MIYMEDAMHDRLTELAEQLRIPVAELIRSILGNYLARKAVRK
jgi:hypothetical protein